MTVPVKRKGIEEIDATILRYADSRSPEQIAEILEGVLSPAAIAARAQTLYKSADWLTAAQNDQAIILRMHALLEEMEGYFQDEKMLALRLRTLESIAGRLDKRKAATDQELTTYTQNIGRELGQVVDEALVYMKGALRKEVDPKKWDEVKREALLHAQMRISEREVEE